MNSHKNYIDHEEIKLGRELALQELKKNKFDDEFIEMTRDLFDRGYFCAITAFCKENNIPEMWNYYAGNFNGAIIEFNNANVEKKVKDLDDGYNNKPGNKNRKTVIAGKVRYHDSSSDGNIFVELLSKYKAHDAECKNGSHRELLLIYLLLLSSLIKNDHYKHEKEYRICCTAIGDPEKPKVVIDILNT